jgi:hypothetical protein
VCNALPTNPPWALVVGYGPFPLCVIHKEGLCPSSGDINRLMMVIGMFTDQLCDGVSQVLGLSDGRHPKRLQPLQHLCGAVLDLFRISCNNQFKIVYSACLHTHNNTYILLTLYPQRGSRGISDIPPRCICFTKII